MNEQRKEWLSVREAAQRRGVTPQRINQMIHAGRIPATRVGAYWAIRPEDLDAWMKEKSGPKKKEE